MKTIHLASLMLFVISLSAFGDVKYLSLKKMKPFALKIGVTSEVVIDFQVRRGMHIQANPASKENLIPTTLTVEEKKGFSFQPPRYPAGKPFRLRGAEEDIATYDGKVVIKLPVTVSAGASPGKKFLKAKLRYQACDLITCYFPITIPLSIPVQVMPSS